MAKKFLLVVLCGFSLALGGVANAGPILADWGFNIDSTTYCDLGPCDNDGVTPSTIPGIDDSGFDWATGLGDITFTIATAGVHSLIAFFDIEIDQPINTFFNEYGDTSGSPSAGQSWEIDEPGYMFGDIFAHFLAGALDNFNNVPVGLEEDVSFAMGWDFLLGAGEIATIGLSIGEIAPESGFYLSHTDPDSIYSVYFSGMLTIDDGSTQVPEPGTLILFGTGLLILGASRRRRKIY